MKLLKNVNSSKFVFFKNCPEDIEVAITTLAERTNCDLVQIIGRNGLLWRRNFKKPKIELPK